MSDRRSGAPAPEERTHPAHRAEEPETVVGFEVFAATAVTFVIALRYRFSPDVAVGLLAAAALLPVTFRVQRRYRGTTPILVLAVLAALSGLLLTWFAAGDGLVNPSRTIVHTARALEIGVGTLALLWSRSLLGTRRVVLVYAIGSFAGLVVNGGVEDANPWKFSLSIPVTLLLLSLSWVYARPGVEAVVLVGLAVVSALNDSRSAAAMMLVAAAMIMTQGIRRSGRRVPTLAVFLRLALIGVAGFYAMQTLVLDGALGEAAQERTIRQIETSGSVILGGRPEIGASVALIIDRPLGYGAGTLVSPEATEVARSGMAALGYDPDNGYVQIYMLGNGFEVHSVLGDLWILFGLAGMVLGVTLLGYVLYGLTSALSRRVATGVLAFLSIRLVWDFWFSPLPSGMETLMLALAVTLPATQLRERAAEDTPSSPTTQVAKSSRT